MYNSLGTDASSGTTALVFGREESGLTEAELRLCSHACSIPSGRVHASLNLSHAVAVVLATCFDLRSRRLDVTSDVALAGAEGNASVMSGVCVCASIQVRRTVCYQMHHRHSCRLAPVTEPNIRLTDDAFRGASSLLRGTPQRSGHTCSWEQGR